MLTAVVGRGTLTFGHTIGLAGVTGGLTGVTGGLTGAAGGLTGLAGGLAGDAGGLAAAAGLGLGAVARLRTSAVIDESICQSSRRTRDPSLNIY